MSLQKYRADLARPATANGAVAWVARWFGTESVAKVANCPCDDGARRTVYVTGEADTAFSIPAACMVKGRRAVGYLTGTEGGLTFRFMDSAIQAHSLTRVALCEESGRPTTWRHYAVSYGNGNDGLSRLYPAFTLWCHPDSIWDVARLAVATTRRASPRFLAREMLTDEAGPDAVQACVLNPPGDRDGGWCDANGAWMLCEVFPASEASDRSEAPDYASPVAAFGRAARAI